MPRKFKEGLDYFPLDVDNDDKLNLIEAEFGIVGWAIIIKLFSRIYKIGYYTKWTDNEILLFKKAINVDINTINDVINKAVERDIFSANLLQKHQILTSKGIQKRYIEATARRKHVYMISEYVIDQINDYINEYNVNIIFQNVDKSTQSKVKESKVNNNAQKTPFALFWDIYDYKKQKQKAEALWNKLSLKDQQDCIDKLPLYKKSTPDKNYRKYPDTFLRNRSWEDEIIIPKEKNHIPFKGEI